MVNVRIVEIVSNLVNSRYDLFMDASDIARDFSRNVERLMAEQNPPWTRAELARQLGVSPPNVTRMLVGTNAPSAETLAGLANLFGVTASDLIREESAAPPVAPRPMGKRK